MLRIRTRAHTFQHLATHVLMPKIEFITDIQQLNIRMTKSHTHTRTELHSETWSGYDLRARSWPQENAETLSIAMVQRVQFVAL